MSSTTTQRHRMAAVDVARAYDVHPATNDLVIGSNMAKGSWSIPCTAPATFHKPRPRRPQVISS